MRGGRGGGLGMVDKRKLEEKKVAELGRNIEKESLESVFISITN